MLDCFRGCRDENGIQLPFDNYVMLAIESPLQHGLLITGPDSPRMNLSSQATWQPVPVHDDSIVTAVVSIESGTRKCFFSYNVVYSCEIDPANC